MRVPREVPLGRGVFVNRADELAWLDELASTRTSVGVISGLPGVGKTSLVSRWIGRGRDLFLDGDVLIDFSAAVSVTDALGHGLSALGVDAAVVPSTLAARSGLWRTQIADRRLLVVLDGVTEPAQVTPFVPSAPGSAVIVLSTNELAELVADGAGRVRLGPLSDEHAARLVEQVAGRDLGDESDALAELVRRCGGLPVALKVAGLRLGRRRSLRVADLVRRIDSGPGLDAFGGQGVDQVFTEAYRALPDSSARVYRLLGVFPGERVDSEVLRVIAGAAVDEVIDGLLESGLVGEDADGALLRHPLVRRHAEQVGWGDPERLAALGRLVDHYVSRAAHADFAVSPRRYRVIDVGDLGDFPGGDPLGWLDRERPVLVALMRAAFDEGWHEPVWRLAEALTVLYVSRRYLVDWTQTSGLGADAARLAGDARAEARLRSFVSRPFTELGDLARAEHELATALPLAEASGDFRLLASVWEMTGRLHDHIAPASAPAAYRRAVDLFAGEDDPRGVAFTLYFLGCSRLAAGAVDEAITVLEDALVRVRAVAEGRMVGRALTSLAEAHAKAGDLERAARELDEAVRVLDGERFFQAIAWERRADVAELQQDLDTVRRCLDRAIVLHTAMGGSRAVDLRVRLAALD